VNKDIRHELYKQVLFEREEMKHTQVFIRSHGHMIGFMSKTRPLSVQWTPRSGSLRMALRHTHTDILELNGRKQGIL